MLGVRYKYVSGFRSSAPARLALQRGEINFFSESSPSYFAVVEPTLVKTGQAIAGVLRPDPRRQVASRRSSGWTTSRSRLPGVLSQAQGRAAVGPDVGRLSRQSSDRCRHAAHGGAPPGVPPAAVEALRRAVARLNDDPEFAKEAQKSLQFVPHYVTGGDLNAQVRRTLVVNPEDRRVRRRITSRTRRSDGGGPCGL